MQSDGLQTHVHFRTLVLGLVAKEEVEEDKAAEGGWGKLLQTEHFQQLMTNVNGFVLIYNYQSGYYEYVSPGVSHNLGFPPEVFMGPEGVPKVYERFHPQDAPSFVHPMLGDILAYLVQHSTAQTGTSFRYGCTLRLADVTGMYNWFLLDTIILQVDDRGFPLRTMVTCTNIEVYKKNEVLHYYVMKKEPDGMYRIVLDRQVNPGPLDHQVLTNREMEILALIGQGHTNRQIAERSFLSIATVKTHRRNILKKTGCKGVSELVKFAFSRGLV